MGLALDEPTKDDTTFDHDGFRVVVDQKLLGDMGGFEVSFRTNPWGGGGFAIMPAYQAESSCGSCTSC